MRKDSLTRRSRIHQKFKAFVPDIDGAYSEEPMVVKFQKDIECFYVILPSWIGDVVGGLNLRDPYKDMIHHWYELPSTMGVEENLEYGVIRATQPRQCIEAFTYIAEQYVTFLKDASAVKYLSCLLQFNVDYVPTFHEGRKDNLPSDRINMPFMPTPALALSHLICYKIDDRFYTKHGNGAYQLMSGANDGKRTYMLHTEEREAFFDNVNQGLTNMICSIIQFFDEPELSIDHAIANNVKLLGTSRRAD